MNAMDLMSLHVGTLFTCNEIGRLIAVNEKGGTAAPRFFLGRTFEGNAFWFRYDLSAEMVTNLRKLCESQPPGLESHTIDAAPFIECLACDEPVLKTWAGPAFHFPSRDVPVHENTVRVTPDNLSVLSPYFEDWRSDVGAGVPMIVVLENGSAVSLCCSVRVSSGAHEAGVETHRNFRGRGFAVPAVSEWARTVREMQRIPLYSTSWDNKSSRALAKKLGLIQFGADFHVT